ncbi:unnamed protein product [Psylliodes chrysocephalus]|uniref:Suppressor of cytokine signaling 5 n=1 Tax=Psylliodes chrysocephalus TaxID=3402493 RepID=A0A9P0GEI3_9CUCU|nr:unnamed protein product [Psylliodes chrysocephala]
MKCKLHGLFHLLTNGIFQNMDNNACTCDEQQKDAVEAGPSTSQEPPKDTSKKSRLNFFNICRDKSLPFTSKREKKSTSSFKTAITRKPAKWGGIRFGSSKKDFKVSSTQDIQNCCRCTCYHRTNEISTSQNMVETSDNNTEEQEDTLNKIEPIVQVVEGTDSREEEEEVSSSDRSVAEVEGVRGIYGTAPVTSSIPNIIISAPFIDMQWTRTPHEDMEEAARQARAREIEEGVVAPANFRFIRRVQLLCSDTEAESQAPRRLQLVCPPDLNVESLRALFQNHVTVRSCPLDTIAGCHTQVDFIHCLVPDLLKITNCSFYWGKMDRYEAERLLDGKPEGTFLLRDSAQEEFLFSVSFRKYERSLHARIEQWNHRFSFDSHDPGVYTSDTVYGLIEHYKDPSSCMFFEPLLTWPLNRKFTFSLQHLSRAVIVSRLTYDDINQLQLPKSLKTYLKEYHYRQKVRVERFDDDMQWLEVRNVPS